jgi:AhpD family alkylhydroperoxidase
MFNTKTDSIQDEQTGSGKSVPWYVLNSPEIGSPFHHFYTACNTEGVLDKKTKELLKLSLASVSHCPHCTESHIKSALEAGASKEEITETLLIIAMEAAETQLNWAKEALLKYPGKKTKS